MKIKDIYPSKYLKASDLPEEGPESFTIKEVVKEEVGKNRESKPVIYFDETEKVLVLNKTNFKTLAKLSDSGDTDDWVGETIDLYRAGVEYQGETFEAVRVKLKTTGR